MTVNLSFRIFGGGSQTLGGFLGSLAGKGAARDVNAVEFSN